ncbi:MAG: DNA gyrase inhibitor YacG [Candidatus Puniceispirillum sp.]|nr:DNA gyrase inhibitor YacG [Candidatus Puniceispirillum sp.]
MSQCPLCHKPTDAQFRPFCSKRCKDVDLGRWFNESYNVPCPPEESLQGDEDEEIYTDHR